MNYEYRNIVSQAASLYSEGFIAYTTLTQMTKDIANTMGMEHQHVQEDVNNLCDFWENNE